jgi:hypothetical protein
MLGAGAAQAQDYNATTTPANPDEEVAPAPIVVEEPGPYSYAWSEPELPSGIGIGLNVGGGISGFTDRSIRDAVQSDVGGLWDARLSLGTHMPLGLDVSYVGTAVDAQSLNGTPNGTLIGTTVEGALRFNVLPHFDWDPYVFAGAGWQHYDVNNMRLAVSDSGMQQSDDFVEFPMGAGLSFRDPGGFTFDLRGTFRAATKSTLLFDPRTDSYANLHMWEASASLGYEF